MAYNLLVLNWQDIRNPLGGGAEVHLHEIFKRIAAKGHRVTLVSCSYPGLPAEEIIDGIRIIRHGHRNFFNFHVPKLYRQLSRQEKFDVVIDDINKIPFIRRSLSKNRLLVSFITCLGKAFFLKLCFRWRCM